MNAQQQAFQRLVDAAQDGRLEQLCERHAVAVLTVFGSARHGDRPAEDLDVAVRFRGDASGDVLALLEDLAELSASSEIDLMDLGRADAVARTAALVDCEPLYEDVEGRFAREQLRAMQDYLDTAWLRARELERLAT